MRAPSRESIERRLAAFIFDELLELPREDEDPLQAGAVDSLGIEQLVEYVAREYGVRLADAEMSRENFESVSALAALVDSKLGTAAA